MRNIAASGMLVLMLCSSAWSQAKPRVSEKPTITVVLPTTEALFEDLKMAFDLAGNPKEYRTLKETIEVFLVGVDPKEPSTIRVFSAGGELPYVLSVPVKNAGESKKLRANLWDLDVKTYDPPAPALLRGIPQAIVKKARGLALAKTTEYLMFNLYEGFMRFEAAAGQVHVGVGLEDVRHAKGGMPITALKGQDLLAVIDGANEPPAARLAAFAKARTEILGAIVKREKESETDFELRKSLAEHQVAEVERFFSESSKIELGWTTSAAEKNAKFALDLAAVANTTLEQSLKLLGETPDEFAGVTDIGTVLKLSINFPLDPMRQQHLQSVSTKARASAKARIDGNEKQTDDQKGVENDLAELGFDIVDDLGKLGVVNAFIRAWSNGDGTLTSVGGIKVPDGTKFVNILQKFAKHGAAAKLEEKVETEGDVEIHRLTLTDLHKDYPELLSDEGTIYIGTSANAAWFAAGDKTALIRLKGAIQEAKAAGPKAGPVVVDLKAQLLPWIEVYDKVETRKKPPAEPKKKTKEVAGDKKAQQTIGLLEDLHLSKVAIDAFKKGKDTLSISLTRVGDDVKLAGQLDTGLIRFVGMAAAKFVKENLGED
ncbi:MAG: hypothetical protein EXS05_22345 [Planctomycetaceae bacterium]|nr:hypothetical protein [Planctomycetaceae bacterium]